MALETKKQAVEVEALIGAQYVQVLVRAEALVPGAGRSAIEPLMAEANVSISGMDVQTDRLVLDGAAYCQAVYRQGEEATLRALTAQATLNQVIDVPGAASGMLSRALAQVEHVEAKYENGHMVFLVTCGIQAQVLELRQIELIDAISGVDGLQTAYEDLCSFKLAADTDADVLVKGEIDLPVALDARTSLMDWGRGVDRKRRAGAGRPAREGTRAGGNADFQRRRRPAGGAGQVPAGIRPAGRAARLARQGRVRHGIHPPHPIAGQRERGRRGRDAFRRRGAAPDRAGERRGLRRRAARRVHHGGETRSTSRGRRSTSAPESTARSLPRAVRGAVLLGENAPGVGTVVAVRVRPEIGQWSSENGRGRIEGPARGHGAVYARRFPTCRRRHRRKCPFSIDVPAPIGEDSWISIEVVSAEANALMSDRLEMKTTLNVCCETRLRGRATVVQDAAEGEPIRKRPGIVILWPCEGEDGWSIGKRYGVPVAGVTNDGARQIAPASRSC